MKAERSFLPRLLSAVINEQVAIMTGLGLLCAGSNNVDVTRECRKWACTSWSRSLRPVAQNHVEDLKNVVTTDQTNYSLTLAASWALGLVSCVNKSNTFFTDRIKDEPTRVTLLILSSLPFSTFQDAADHREHPQFFRYLLGTIISDDSIEVFSVNKHFPSTSKEDRSTVCISAIDLTGSDVVGDENDSLPMSENSRVVLKSASFLPKVAKQTLSRHWVLKMNSVNITNHNEVTSPIFRGPSNKDDKESLARTRGWLIAQNEKI